MDVIVCLYNFALHCRAVDISLFPLFVFSHFLLLLHIDLGFLGLLLIHTIIAHKLLIGIMEMPNDYKEDVIRSNASFTEKQHQQ